MSILTNDIIDSLNIEDNFPKSFGANLTSPLFKPTDKKLKEEIGSLYSFIDRKQLENIAVIKHIKAVKAASTMVSAESESSQLQSSSSSSTATTYEPISRCKG